jgi:hypothetical protein
MPRGRADLANTALRIFLQEMGAAYDEERGLKPYGGRKDFPEVRAFFDDRCCYCGDALVAGRVAQDHLIPVNKAGLGLHAWGNVVPACQVAPIATHRELICGHRCTKAACRYRALPPRRSPAGRWSN